MDIDQIGGRKFITAILVIISTCILTWFNKIDGGVYSTVVIAAMMTFTAGNVFQKTQGGDVKMSTPDNTK